MKTYTRVYDTYDQAKRVVSELESEGVPSSEISLVANKQISDEHDDVEDASATATGATLGAALGGGAGLLAGLGIMAIPGLGPVVAAGWLATTALGAAAGAATGGLIGVLVDSGESEENAHVYSEAIRRGGTLVTVRTDEKRGTRVETVLDRHEPIDPDARRADYGREGWKNFDPEEDTYQSSKADIKQKRRA